MILEIGQIMADPVKFSTFLSDKYIPYLKYIAFRQDSRFILRYEDLRNRPVMEMTEFMETTVRQYDGPRQTWALTHVPCLEARERAKTHRKSWLSARFSNFPTAFLFTCSSLFHVLRFPCLTWTVIQMRVCHAHPLGKKTRRQTVR